MKVLARRHGINAKSVAKWKARGGDGGGVKDRRPGPREPGPGVLTLEQEAAIVALRRHTLLPLDDCLYALQASIPPLTRSNLHRFELACAQNGLAHRLTKPRHPWTNGQVERLDRTLKEATVRRYHYRPPGPATRAPGPSLLTPATSPAG